MRVVVNGMVGLEPTAKVACVIHLTDARSYRTAHKALPTELHTIHYDPHNGGTL